MWWVILRWVKPKRRRTRRELLNTTLDFAQRKKLKLCPFFYSCCVPTDRVTWSWIIHSHLGLMFRNTFRTVHRELHPPVRYDDGSAVQFQNSRKGVKGKCKCTWRDALYCMTLCCIRVTNLHNFIRHRQYRAQIVVMQWSDVVVWLTDPQHDPQPTYNTRPEWRSKWAPFKITLIATCDWGAEKVNTYTTTTPVVRG